MKKGLFLLAAVAMFAACGGKAEAPVEAVEDAMDDAIEQVEEIVETESETIEDAE